MPAKKEEADDKKVLDRLVNEIKAIKKGQDELIMLGLERDMKLEQLSQLMEVVSKLSDKLDVINCKMDWLASESKISEPNIKLKKTEKEDIKKYFKRRWEENSELLITELKLDKKQVDLTIKTSITESAKKLQPKEQHTSNGKDIYNSLSKDEKKALRDLQQLDKQITEKIKIKNNQVPDE